MQLKLKEMENIFENLEYKVEDINRVKEAIIKNSHNTRKNISLEPLEKEINDINEKVRLLKEKAIVEMDEETSRIYKELNEKAMFKGRRKISETKDKKLGRMIEDDNILDEFYKKPAYFELLEELEEKLKNIPLEIERLQIEYYKKSLILLDSYVMEDDKKETIEKIKYLKEDEMDYKELIQQLKEKFGIHLNNN